MIKAEHLPSLIMACGLCLLWALEAWLPAADMRRGRRRHAARNVSLGLLNAAALALLAGPFVARADGWAEDAGLGLLRLLALPPAGAAVVALLLLDGWMYLWHRANHQVELLWRFHRVHHSDPEMDATTALRFHPGEVLIAAALRLAVIPLLGVSLGQLLIYESVLLPVILFHHSNVNFPERFDRRLRVVLVSPAVHRIHHSRVMDETNGNYASVFSFWDRIAGTFRLRRDGRPVDFGLDGYDGEERQQVAGLLTMPFTSLPLGYHSTLPPSKF